jgi:SAM-dependent methyltransferase
VEVVRSVAPEALTNKLIDARKIRRQLAAPEPTGVRRRWYVLRQRLINMTARMINRVLTVFEGRTGRRSVECPICGWRGIRFRPYTGPAYLVLNGRCPGCRAAERHRLIASFWPRVPTGGRCLSVAPEACLRSLVEADGRVITTDLARGGVDVVADIEHLPMPSGAFSLVLCSDVLEHVVDDRAALREVRRVLAEDGTAIIHVPIMLTETVDYGRAIDDDYGHRRTYGPDLLSRFADAQLAVTVLAARDLGRSEQKRRGLRDDVVLLARRPASS